MNLAQTNKALAAHFGDGQIAVAIDVRRAACYLTGPLTMRRQPWTIAQEACADWDLADWIDAASRLAESPEIERVVDLVPTVELTAEGGLSAVLRTSPNGQMIACVWPLSDASTDDDRRRQVSVMAAQFRGAAALGTVVAQFVARVGMSATDEPEGVLQRDLRQIAADGVAALEIASVPQGGFQQVDVLPVWDSTGHTMSCGPRACAPHCKIPTKS